jgi:photosystem II stability/assembly factor-like uncharacterized protein
LASAHPQSFVYLGLGTEAPLPLGEGGLYRYAVRERTWQDISRGLPPAPQVRALLLHPRHPSVLFAGTQLGVYRSDDRGEHWQPLGVPREGRDVWSLACDPSDPNVLFAGFDPCAIERSDDGGAHWKRMNTEAVVFPHITTTTPPLVKRVIGIAADPSNARDVYAAVEVGGLLGSRDGGESWVSLIDAPYVRNNTLDLHAVAVSRAAPGDVFIASQIALFRGRERGRRWQRLPIEEMFPGGAYCRDVVVAPDGTARMYAAASAWGGAAPAGTREVGALFRSGDAGDTWQRLDLGEIPTQRILRVAIDRAAPTFVCCTTSRGRVYSSPDAGETWTSDQVPLELSPRRHPYCIACG